MRKYYPQSLSPNPRFPPCPPVCSLPTINKRFQPIIPSAVYSWCIHFKYFTIHEENILSRPDELWKCLQCCVCVCAHVSQTPSVTSASEFNHSLDYFCNVLWNTDCFFGVTLIRCHLSHLLKRDMRVLSVVKQMPPWLSLSPFLSFLSVSISLCFTHSLFLSQTAGNQSLILNQLLLPPHADVLNCRDGQLDPDIWFSFFDNLLPSSSFVPLFHSHISSAHIDNLWNMMFFFRVEKKKKDHVIFFSSSPYLDPSFFRSLPKCLPDVSVSTKQKQKVSVIYGNVFFFFISLLEKRVRLSGGKTSRYGWICLQLCDVRNRKPRRWGRARGLAYEMIWFELIPAPVGGFQPALLILRCRLDMDHHPHTHTHTNTHTWLMPQLGHLTQPTACVSAMKGPLLCPDGDINTKRVRLSTHLHQSAGGEQQVERDRHKMEDRRKE